MVSYIVTGGTSFLGRRVVQRLLDRDPAAIVHVGTHPRQRSDFDALAAGWRGGERAFALTGAHAPRVDHLIHLGPLHDPSDDASATAAALDLARNTGAFLHHVSSIAVAGEYAGTFFEEDFDLGQKLTSRQHRATFAAERAVRESGVPRWRIYRPGVVVGDSRTGEMDRIDGPYHFFSAVGALAGLPAELPIPLPDLGATNVVPVDYVAEAVVALVHRPGLLRRTFHLVNPEPQPFVAIYRALATAAGAPTGAGVLPVRAATLGALTQLPGVTTLRDLVFERLGLPAAAAPHLGSSARFISDSTRAQLRGTGIEPPAFDSYAATLWRYWRDHLDPRRARRGTEGARGRTALVSGTSSGVGPAAAHSRTRGLTLVRDGEDFRPPRDGVVSDVVPESSALTALAPMLRPLLAMPGPAGRMARIVPGLRR
ncbi:SDR family oxidoreductase [Nocardia takedensis]